MTVLALQCAGSLPWSGACLIAPALVPQQKRPRPPLHRTPTVSFVLHAALHGGRAVLGIVLLEGRGLFEHVEHALVLIGGALLRLGLVLVLRILAGVGFSILLFVLAGVSGVGLVLP